MATTTPNYSLNKPDYVDDADVDLLNDNADTLDETIGNLVLTPSAAFAIPSAGSSVSYNLVGITADHIVVAWNFSSSEDNNPPCDITVTTYAGYFTVSHTGSRTTSETMKPIFAVPRAVAITVHS